MGEDISITSDMLSRITDALGEKFPDQPEITDLVDDLLKQEQLRQDKQDCYDVSKSARERYVFAHLPGLLIQKNAINYGLKGEKLEALLDATEYYRKEVALSIVNGRNSSSNGRFEYEKILGGKVSRFVMDFDSANNHFFKMLSKLQPTLGGAHKIILKHKYNLDGEHTRELVVLGEEAVIKRGVGGVIHITGTLAKSITPPAQESEIYTINPARGFTRATLYRYISIKNRTDIVRMEIRRRGSNPNFMFDYCR